MFDYLDVRSCGLCHEPRRCAPACCNQSSVPPSVPSRSQSCPPTVNPSHLPAPPLIMQLASRSLRICRPRSRARELRELPDDSSICTVTHTHVFPSLAALSATFLLPTHDRPHWPLDQLAIRLVSLSARAQTVTELKELCTQFQLPTAEDREEAGSDRQSGAASRRGRGRRWRWCPQ